MTAREGSYSSRECAIDFWAANLVYISASKVLEWRGSKHASPKLLGLPRNRCFPGVVLPRLVQLDLHDIRSRPNHLGLLKEVDHQVFPMAIQALVRGTSADFHGFRYCLCQ